MLACMSGYVRKTQVGGREEAENVKNMFVPQSVANR